MPRCALFTVSHLWQLRTTVIVNRWIQNVDPIECFTLRCYHNVLYGLKILKEMRITLHFSSIFKNKIIEGYVKHTQLILITIMFNEKNFRSVKSEQVTRSFSVSKDKKLSRHSIFIKPWFCNTEPRDGRKIEGVLN